VTDEKLRVLREERTLRPFSSLPMSNSRAGVEGAREGPP
jgi:hypothetical protein